MPIAIMKLAGLAWQAVQWVIPANRRTAIVLDIALYGALILAAFWAGWSWRASIYAADVQAIERHYAVQAKRLQDEISRLSADAEAKQEDRQNVANEFANGQSASDGGCVSDDSRLRAALGRIR